MAETIPLVIALGKPAREYVAAIADERVEIENCSASFVDLEAGEMLHRAFSDPSFNVAELSLSNYVIRREQRNCPYVALPVYISRSFRHSDIYVRTDRAIKRPQDLRARRIGIAEYQHTAYVWARGMLEHEYGIRPTDVRWICLAGDSHGDHGSGHFVPPYGVSVESAAPAKTLSDLLEHGNVDAIISPRVPACFTRGSPHVGRLFPDYRAVEDDYFRRTQIFPILHIMGIRTELVEAYPALAPNVFNAFVAAKNLALSAQIAAAEAAPADSVLRNEVQRMWELMGEDYYSYGLDARDRGTLETFLRYHFEQGLSRRQGSVEELFAPVPIANYRNAGER